MVNTLRSYEAPRCPPQVYISAVATQATGDRFGTHFEDSDVLVRPIRRRHIDVLINLNGPGTYTSSNVTDLPQCSG